MATLVLTKAQILAYVNRRIKGGDAVIDDEIKDVLDDLSDLYVFKGQDAAQTLTTTSTTLAYPSACMDGEQAIISVVLTDSSGVAQEPLIPYPGGWNEYLNDKAYKGSGDRSVPAYFVCHNRLIYLYPQPGANYTVAIDYFKRQNDIETIVCDDSWRKTILFGCCFEVACSHKNVDQIKIWGSRYEAEKEKQRIIHDDSVAVTRTSDMGQLP